MTTAPITATPRAEPPILHMPVDVRDLSLALPALLATVALVALLQFGTLNMALAVGGASLVIHTVVGTLLAPPAYQPRQ